jgi:TatD DNase family protein
VYGKPVKGRNEPSAIGGVAWVIHKLNDVPMEEISERAWSNTVEMFGLIERQ